MGSWPLPACSYNKTCTRAVKATLASLFRPPWAIWQRSGGDKGGDEQKGRQAVWLASGEAGQASKEMAKLVEAVGETGKRSCHALQNPPA